MTAANKKKLLITFSFIIGLFVLSGCALQKGDNAQGFTKEKIAQNLSAQGVSKAVWSPDNTKVIFVQNEDGSANSGEGVYLWKVGEKEPSLVKNISDKNIPEKIIDFIWAPDSSHVLIGEKSGDKIKSLIVNGESLEKDPLQIDSTGMPVWSPDSLSLAYSNEVQLGDMKWGTVEVYRLGTEKGEYLRNNKNYQYNVEKWNEEGEIIITEINEQGEKTRRTAKNIRPNISGIYLGDSMDQVRSVLGDDYKEFPPDEDILSYPEPVFAGNMKRDIQ